MPERFSSKDWFERDYLRHDRAEYNVSIYVRKIIVQPSKYKPVSLDPVELEVLRLKRAVVSIDVKEDSKESQITAVIEFRGKGLTLSRTKGDCDVGQIAWRLSKYHFSRYRKAVLRIHSPPNSSELCDCTLENADQFLDFLHLIQTNRSLIIRVWHERVGHLGKTQQESFKLGSKETQSFP